MKWSFNLLVIFTAFVSACQTEKPVLSYEPKFVLADTSLVKISADQQYTFGYLEVPENRSRPNSKTIRLPVYIFESRNPNPQPDPIIYTVGGPGYSTMPSAAYMKYYSYLDDRDFILFEQRGTKYAQPHLDCPEWAEAVYRSNLPGFDESQSDSLFAIAAKNCRQRLTSQGIDLDGYRTTETAADIADLRKELNLDEYNLLTISYSSKIAQVMMRDYPEGLRGVVMDSPLPLEVNYDEESVSNLILIAENLLADSDTTFPNLKDRFFDYLKRITENPLEVQVVNPVTGSEEIVYLQGKDLLPMIVDVSTNDIPAVPQQIEKVLNGDLSIVKQQLTSLFESPGDGAGIGMRLSVWCAEEFSFTDQAIVNRETNRYPECKGLSPAVFGDEICKIWRVEPAPSIDNQPVNSDIPVLLISGTYDAATPVKWAAQMQKHLPNSHHLIFKGWTHTPTTNWGDNCAMKMAQAFFNDPWDKPKNDCFE